MIKIKFLDKEQREQVGFSFIMDMLQVTTPYGLEEKKNARPFRRKEKEKLIKEFDYIECIRSNMKDHELDYKEIGMVFCKVKDIRNTLKRCSAGETLDEVELYEIKYFAMLLEEIAGLYEGLELDMECIKFNDLKDIIALLDPENKGLSTFYIYDQYSEKLKTIREEKRKLEDEIMKAQEEESVEKLKDDRLKLVIAEEEEEFIIRKNLSEKLVAFMPLVEQNATSLGKLDFLIAKAKLPGIRPDICEASEVELKGAYNPEVAEILKAKGKEFTPVSIRLKKGTTVITGANMGGKSVTLKTIVLNLMLGQMGFFVFCASAKIPILDFIYFVSDDMQSVSKGLSTFGAEIIKLRDIVEDVKEESGFIALDEFARGTNPSEGFYLVKSLCKYLDRCSSISVVSTHYDGVVEEGIVHYQVRGLKNVDFEAIKSKINLNKKNSVEIIQEYMDYTLERVTKLNHVPKDALNICTLLGLEQEIIDIAKSYYEK